MRMLCAIDYWVHTAGEKEETLCNGCALGPESHTKNCNTVRDDTYEKPKDNVESVLGDTGLKIIAFLGWLFTSGSGGILLR